MTFLSCTLGKKCNKIRSLAIYSFTHRLLAYYLLNIRVTATLLTIVIGYASLEVKSCTLIQAKRVLAILVNSFRSKNVRSIGKGR